MFLVRSFTFGHALGVSLLGHAIVLGAIDLSALSCPYKIEPASLIQVGYIRGDDRELGAGELLDNVPSALVTAPVAQEAQVVPPPVSTPKPSNVKVARVTQPRTEPVRAQLRAPIIDEPSSVVTVPTSSGSAVGSATNVDGQLSIANAGIQPGSIGGGVGRGNGRGAFGPGDSPVQIVSSPKPRYPDDARTFGFEGRVTLETRIGVDGKVKEIQVLKSSGRKDCDESALRVVRDRWRFKPASLGGEPMETIERISVRYALVAD